MAYHNPVNTGEENNMSLNEATSMITNITSKSLVVGTSSSLIGGAAGFDLGYDVISFGGYSMSAWLYFGVVSAISKQTNAYTKELVIPLIGSETAENYSQLLSPVSTGLMAMAIDTIVSYFVSGQLPAIQNVATYGAIVSISDLIAEYAIDEYIDMTEE